MTSKEDIHPPKWANHFLEWYCHEDLLHEIQGDLLEQYHKNYFNLGKRKANRRFILDVIRFFRPSSFKQTKINMNTQIINNYLKVAFRVFKKEKGYTFSNILGLALGITCSLFIYLWVQDEISYNQWPDDLDKVHMVLAQQEESSGVIHTWTTTPQPLQPVLQEKYPAIEKAAIIDWGTQLITRKDDGYLTIKGNYGSPELFEVFDIPFLKGSNEPMFDQPESVVLSASAAARYFGKDWETQDIIGTSIITSDDKAFELVGVFQDIPKNSTIHFDFIIPFDYMLTIYPWNKRWGNYNNMIYVKIADGYTTETAQENITNAILENSPDAEDNTPLILQPFADQYLYTKYENGVVAGGRIDYVRLLSISAILILVLASVNFVNLTTARSAKRSKETGIRKVMGAQRKSLRYQFIIEAILITIGGFIVSAIAVALLLPSFNSLSGKEIGWEFFTPQFIISCTAFILLLGIISGLYPALYMASLNPILSIKGIIKADRSNALFRKGLVVCQFAITIIMIIGSVTIYEQIQYIFTKNLGLDYDNVLTSRLSDMSKSEIKTFKSRLIQMEGIADLSTTNQDPTNIANSTSSPSWEGKDPNMDIYFHVLGVDENFISMMNIPLKSGRNFDASIASDSANFIINEVTANLIGKEDPIGTKLDVWNKSGRIIGVVKNFHIESLHIPIEPLIMRIVRDPEHLQVKTQPGEMQKAIASMESLFKEYQPERTFNFKFLDEVYQNRYKSEQLVSKLTLYFTIVAIVISCLGLLSLISFSTELKTKEIGIRKVLGASVYSILQLVGREYLLLIVLAFAIATPIASYIMNNWLDQFAYSIHLNLGLFIIAGATAILITLITIANHAIRSATRNPVESLRSE